MSRADSRDNIVAYYDQAKIDYQLAWHLNKQLACYGVVTALRSRS